MFPIIGSGNAKVNAMTFTKPWAIFPDYEVDERRPALEIYFRVAARGFHRQIALVDSGADVSMASKDLCEVLGLDWTAGTRTILRGISQKPECAVAGMIHPVDLFIREVGVEITIPFCFADGPAPLLLGREGFFDTFRITFDKRQFATVFERL